MKRHPYGILLTALVLVGCQTVTAPTVAPLATPTQAPAATPDTTPSAAPSVSPAPGTSTPAPSADPAPTPTPAATAAPSGGSGGGGRRNPAPTPTPAVSLFVMNGLGKTIDEVDLSTGAVSLSVLTTGLYPNQLHRAGTNTYLVNSGDANILKLNLLARTASAPINLPTGSNPFVMVPLPDAATEALIVNYFDSNDTLLADVSFLNLTTELIEADKTVDLPTGNPTGGALIHAGKAYVPATAATYGGAPDYAATYTFSGVYVIDLATHAIVATIALPDDANPGHISRDPASGLIHVCTQTGIALIDPATDTLRAGGLTSPVPLHGIRYVSATLAYAAVYDGLVSFNPATQAFIKGPDAKIPAGGDTSVGDFLIHDGKAYVPNFANDTVTVVDLATETVIGTPFPVGDGPQAVVVQTRTP